MVSWRQFGIPVLFLRVLTKEIVGLHQARIAVVRPALFEQMSFFEGMAYRRHLTLLHAQSDAAGNRGKVKYEAYKNRNILKTGILGWGEEQCRTRK